MSLEHEIEDAFVAYADSRGCLALKLRIDGKIGFPDRTIFTIRGVFFIEFKKPGGRLSVSQKKWIEELRSFGFQCGVVDDLGDAKRTLDEFLDG